MGYSQYLKNPDGFTNEQWDEFTADAKLIFERAKKRGIELGNHYGEKGTEPVIDDSRVSFNGLGEDSHETCQILKKGESFAFCKTARKPYDWAVVEIYKLVKKIVPSAKISSDGGPSVFLEKSAFDLIGKSDILEIDGYHLSSWNLEETDEDAEIALEFSYTDAVGFVYEFEFNLENLKNAWIDGNVITLHDNTGYEVKIKCFKLTPVSA